MGELLTNLKYIFGRKPPTAPIETPQIVEVVLPPNSLVITADRISLDIDALLPSFNELLALAEDGKHKSSETTTQAPEGSRITQASLTLITDSAKYDSLIDPRVDAELTVRLKPGFIAILDPLHSKEVVTRLKENGFIATIMGYSMASDHTTDIQGYLIHPTGNPDHNLIHCKLVRNNLTFSEPETSELYLDHLQMVANHVLSIALPNP